MSDSKKNALILINRIIVGGIFIISGWMKVFAIAATIGFFASVGIPAFLAYVVGYAELVGGVLIVLGLWSSLTSAVLAVIMIFAVWYTRSMGFEGMVTPLATLSGLLGVLVSGAGKYAPQCKKKDGATVA